MGQQNQPTILVRPLAPSVPFVESKLLTMDNNKCYHKKFESDHLRKCGNTNLAALPGKDIIRKHFHSNIELLKHHNKKPIKHGKGISFPCIKSLSMRHASKHS